MNTNFDKSEFTIKTGHQSKEPVRGKSQNKRLYAGTNLSPLILSGIFNELNSFIFQNSTITELKIAERILEYGLKYHLSSSLLSDLNKLGLQLFEIKIKRHDCFEELEISPKKIECCYSVFHSGELHFYYNVLPDYVLKMKENKLFWINLADHEYFSLEEIVPKEFKLEPKHIEILMYLCRENMSGKFIKREDIYQNVWLTSNETDPNKINNTISVASNKINAFAKKEFISEKSDYVKLIHGGDKYLVSDTCIDAICIINKTAVNEKK